MPDFLTQYSDITIPICIILGIAILFVCFYSVIQTQINFGGDDDLLEDDKQYPHINEEKQDLLPPDSTKHRYSKEDLSVDSLCKKTIHNKV